MNNIELVKMKFYEFLALTTN